MALGLASREKDLGKTMKEGLLRSPDGMWKWGRRTVAKELPSPATDMRWNPKGRTGPVYLKNYFFFFFFFLIMFTRIHYITITEYFQLQNLQLARNITSTYTLLNYKFVTSTNTMLTYTYNTPLTTYDIEELLRKPLTR